MPVRITIKYMATLHAAQISPGDKKYPTINADFLGVNYDSSR